MCQTKEYIVIVYKMNHSSFIQNIEAIRVGSKAITGDTYWYGVVSHTSLSTLTHSYPISVKPSTYGKGVFAECDIPKETVITMYPAHHYTRYVGGGNHTVYQVDGLPPPDMTYAMTCDNKNILIGCPSVTNNHWFLGHMINDVCSLPAYKKGREASWMVDYMIRNIKYTNVKYVTKDDFIYVMTKRDIKAGEELLAVYGYGYWFNKLGCPDWESRVMRYIRTLPSHKQEHYMNLFNID